MTPAAMAYHVSRGKWRPAKHLLYTSRKLVNVAARRTKRLIVTEPPRHGKSELISRYFPAWYLGIFPDERIILTSYEADFAASWGRKARDTVEEFGGELFGIRVRQDSSAANRWDIEGHSGGMVTAGAGGPITGRGGNVIIIDDPFKNAEEANSKRIRDKVWEWYQSTLYTRLEPGGAIIIVMTRWHEDDLVGRLLNPEYGEVEDWEIINLPAVAEEGDVLGREPGEALWPERYDLAELKRIKKTVGSYWWNALYQQKPSPAAGNKFKRAWFRYFEIDDEHVVLHTPGEEQERKRVPLNQCWCFQTCDPAASTKTSADYFVLATWLVTPNRDLLLRDIIRTRLEGPDQPKLFEQGYRRWNPKLQGVETKNMGLTLYQELRRKGLPVLDLKAETDKETRALPVMARMEAGTVYFLQGASWLGDYEDELLVFPNGEYDDQVDVTSYAGIIVAGRRHTGPVAKPAGW